MGNTKSSGEDAQYAFALIFGGNGHIGIIAGHGSEAAGDSAVRSDMSASQRILGQQGISGRDKLLRGGNRVRGGVPDFIQQGLCKHGIDQFGKVRNEEASGNFTVDITECGICSTDIHCYFIHLFYG